MTSLRRNFRQLRSYAIAAEYYAARALENERSDPAMHRRQLENAAAMSDFAFALVGAEKIRVSGGEAEAEA